MPPRASPMPKPTMPASTRGVSNTRSWPKRSCRLSDALNTPPMTPTSWPKRSTRSSRSRAMARASLMACTIVMGPRCVLGAAGFTSAATEGLPGRPLVGSHLLEHVLHDLGRGRLRRGVRHRQGLPQLLLQFGLDLLLQFGRQQAQPREGDSETCQGLLGGAPAALGLVAVTAGVVAGGVRGYAVGHGLYQGRPLTVAGARHRLPRGDPGGHEVVAVDPRTVDAVAGGAVHYAHVGHLALGGCADGPAVVLHHEHHRCTVDAREV